MKSVVRPILSCVVLGLAGAAPGGLAAAEPEPSPPAALPPAPALSPHGFVQMMGDAIGEVTLRPEQEADVEKLSTEIEPLQAHVDVAENALLSALADQVETGKIDEEALYPLVSSYVAARQEVSPTIRRIIDDLHAIFDPGQRADFSDALECELHDVRRAILTGEHLDDFAKKLNLDGDQVARLEDGITSSRPVLEAQRNLLHRVTEAFRGEDYSTDELLPHKDVAARARKRAERMIDMTASLLDVLDPAQRAPFAERLREAADARSEPQATSADATSTDAEDVGVAIEHLWVGAGVRRGGVRGRAWMGAPARYYYGRVVAYPYAAGWGYGW